MARRTRNREVPPAPTPTATADSAHAKQLLVPLGFLLGFAIFIWIASSMSDWAATRQVENAQVAAKEAAAQVRALAGSDAECSNSKPCMSKVGMMGVATLPVHIRDGYNVCFGPTFWSDLHRLGFTVKYQSLHEHRYTCTREQALAGMCSEADFDTFWFIPESGVTVPSHWFVPKGAACTRDLQF